MSGQTATELFEIAKVITHPRLRPADFRGPFTQEPDPPLFREQQAKNKRRTKVVNRILDELSDADRRVIAFSAASAAAAGWSA